MKNSEFYVLPTQILRDESSMVDFLCVFCRNKKEKHQDIARFVLAFNNKDVKKTFMCSSCSSKKTTNLDVIATSEEAINLICNMAKDIISLHGVKQKKYGTKLVPLLNSYNALMLTRIGKLNLNCGFCNKKTPKYRCSGCNLMQYCSETCSRRDWPQHKKICQSLKIISDDAVLINL